ncbi:hypothetical protein ACSBR1_009302 [Camellia fascicularis]
MLLGKRPRGPMRRTTSMNGMNVDLGNVEASDDIEKAVMNGQGSLGEQGGPAKRSVVLGGPTGLDHRLMATVSPRYHNTKTCGGDDIVVETADFLRMCGLCKRRLTPGRDIYMYRGNTAFCSEECREKQMKHDERKEKCSLSASKKDDTDRHHHSTSTATATATAISEA